MKSKFISVYMKFILAAGFCLLAFMSYSKQSEFSLKVILLLLVTFAWIMLGTFNLLKWKAQENI